jgi:hypothetical protein
METVLAWGKPLELIEARLGQAENLEEDEVASVFLRSWAQG